MEKTYKHRHLIYILIVWAALLAVAWVAQLDYSPPAQKMLMGATFSEKYARDWLNLEWKKAYITLLDELGIKRLRLMSYWDEIEKEKDSFNFENLDYMMDEAGRRGVKVIITVGLRQPRWPECHIPAWAPKMPSEYEPLVMRLVTETVKRYKDHPATYMWQVENEPLLSFFGNCQPTNFGFLAREIQEVEKIDPNHDVITTASGEFTNWKDTAKYTDKIGVSLYRVIEKKFLGTIYYPLFPAFYRLRAKLSLNEEKIFLSEVQAEPWTNKGITKTPIEEQYAQFSPQNFINQIRFARATGFEEQYLWGTEWWYWLKENNHPEIWNLAKQLFKNGIL